jgi:hypothetical protein
MSKRGKAGLKIYFLMVDFSQAIQRRLRRTLVRFDLYAAYSKAHISLPFLQAV